MHVRRRDGGFGAGHAFCPARYAMPDSATGAPPGAGARPPVTRDSAREPTRGTVGEPVGARVFRLVVGTVVVAAALKLAQPVLVPLVAGVFLAVLARPLQRAVAGRLPGRLRWLGLVAAMLVVLGGVTAFGSAVYLTGRAVAGELRDRRPRLEAAAAEVRQRLARTGVPASAVPPVPGAGGATSSPGSAAPARGSSPEAAPSGGASGAASGQPSGEASGGGSAGTVRRATTGLVEALGSLLLALAFCALGLAESGAARRRLVRAVPDRATPAVLQAVDEAAAAFRRYAWVKTLTSAITGLATFGAALAFGLPLAWVWGFIAFLLEYIPSVGSALAVLPPTLMAVADGGPSRGLMVFLVVGALQVFFGNVVDPKLEGRFMAVSPFVVLLSIVVWGWLWGPVGALLAVPMTVAAVIVARHTPGAHGVATLLTEGREDDHT
jgi:predicted PurR-regulated permease PerM